MHVLLAPGWQSTACTADSRSMLVPLVTLYKPVVNHGCPACCIRSASDFPSFQSCLDLPNPIGSFRNQPGSGRRPTCLPSMAGAGLRLYHSPMTRSVTVEWYLRELQLDAAEIVPVDFQNKEHKGETFLKINPFGRLPTLTDGDFKLFEMGAILMYLAEAYSNNPAYSTPKGRAQANKWMYFAYTTLTEAMFSDHLRARTQKEVLTVLDELLSQQQYLDGDGAAFGVADVAVSSFLLYAGAFMPPEVTNLRSYPHIVAYVDKAMARPTVTSGLQALVQGWDKKVKGQQAPHPEAVKAPAEAPAGDAAPTATASGAAGGGEHDDKKQRVE